MDLKTNTYSNTIEGIDYLNGYREVGNEHYYYESFLKKKDHKKLVLVFHHHGYCDYAAMNSFVFNHLNDAFLQDEKSLALVSFDNIGHGLSSGKRLTIDNLDKYVERAKLFLQDLLETYKSYEEIKIIISGHSMGGFIVTKLCENLENDTSFSNKIAGLFLLSPYFFLNEDRPITALGLKALQKIPFVGNKICDFVVSTGGKTSDLCNDNRYTIILDNLYLYGKNYFTFNWVTTMRNSQLDFMYSPKSNWKTKIFILMASDERLVNNTSTEAFYDKLPSNCKLGCELAPNTMHKIFFSAGRNAAATKYFSKMNELIKSI